MSGGFFLAGIGAIQAADDLGGGVVQYTDEAGRLFTLYEHVPSGTDWEVRDGPFTAGPGVELPDMQAVVACGFECRWPDLVVRLADVVARTVETPAWLLDGDGVICTKVLATYPHDGR